MLLVCVGSSDLGWGQSQLLTANIPARMVSVWEFEKTGQDTHRFYYKLQPPNLWALLRELCHHLQSSGTSRVHPVNQHTVRLFFELSPNLATSTFVFTLLGNLADGLLDSEH